MDRNPARSAAAIAARHAELGAEASHAMTLCALAGRPAAFYPQGRSEQRPSTLEPKTGESTHDVVVSLIEASAALDEP